MFFIVNITLVVLAVVLVLVIAATASMPDHQALGADLTDAASLGLSPLAGRNIVPAPVPDLSASPPQVVAAGMQ